MTRIAIWLVWITVLAVYLPGCTTDTPGTTEADTVASDTTVIAEAGPQRPTTSRPESVVSATAAPTTGPETTAAPDSQPQLKYAPSSFNCGDYYTTNFPQGAPEQNPSPLRDHELIWAVSEGDLALVSRLLEEGADPNDANEEYLETPLLMATMWNCSEIAITLLDFGADPNLVLDDAASPLVHAARSNNLFVIESLLAAGADPNIRSSEGTTPLHEAISTEAVELLVDSGADVGARDGFGMSPIESATLNDWIDGIVTLAESGADIDDATAAAIYWQRVETVRWLVASAGTRDITPIEVNGESFTAIEYAQHLLDTRTYQNKADLEEIVDLLATP